MTYQAPEPANDNEMSIEAVIKLLDKWQAAPKRQYRPRKRGLRLLEPPPPLA